MEDARKKEEMKKLREVYETIADSWSNLRTRPEDFVKEFAEAKGLLIDISCGNCRNMIPFLERGVNSIGMDYSRNMIKNARKNLLKKKFQANLVIGDATQLPFKAKIFNTVLFNAALHHIPSRKLRIATLRNLKNSCNSKCKLLISVWAFRLHDLPGYVLTLFKRRGEFGDVYKKWNFYGRLCMRFYHQYTLNEFKDDLERAGFEIKTIYKHKGNAIAVCET